MIIFANVRKSIDCKGFILLNVHPAYISGNTTLSKESVGAIVSVYPLVTTPPIIQADTPTRIVDVIACRARIGIRCSE